MDQARWAYNAIIFEAKKEIPDETNSTIIDCPAQNAES